MGAMERITHKPGKRSSDSVD